MPKATATPKRPLGRTGKVAAEPKIVTRRQRSQPVEKFDLKEFKRDYVPKYEGVYLWLTGFVVSTAWLVVILVWQVWG